MVKLAKKYSRLFAIGLCTFAVVCSSAQAESDYKQRGLYVGVFGGGTVSDSDSITQSGIAHKVDGQAGSHATYDLMVNVNGRAESQTGSIGGLHVGYEWAEISFGNNNSGWGVSPAVEVEGYYLGSKQSGNLSNPQIEPAIADGHLESSHSIAAGVHTFRDTFNLDIGVLLVNGIFNFKTPWFDKIYPYIGAGVGAAIIGVSGADSVQTDPLKEYPPYYPVYINHFNSRTQRVDSSFAVQAKAGIRAEIVDHLSVFAEYRYLHINSSNYTFGATVYDPVAVHAETSHWNTRFGGMNFHSGVFGIEYSF